MYFEFASESKKAVKFTALCAQLKALTQNVRFMFNEDGLYIQCMDDGHCCLFEARLQLDFFDKYEPDSTALSLDVNLPMLNKVLHTRQEHQTLGILYEADKQPDVLQVSFTSDKKGVFDKYFELRLIDMEMELMDVSQFDTLVDLSMESKHFSEVVSQLTLFNDTLTLAFYDEQIKLRASGQEGNMQVIIDGNDVSYYAIPAETTFKQSYSLRYVQLMCQFNKLATQVAMGFGETCPMTMTYFLDDQPAIPTETDDADTDAEEAPARSFVRIHLAPKMTDEADADAQEPDVDMD
jgi:proliferating cell nuclear antigen PCNA